ncbi:hypothetical protein [Desulfovibrio subterraneus]|uniref:Uncharacterized protein n=1 Tax=Desulfovibrio subterraneus TaxID=2718620 RepID=A0A7J0BEV4_9BACT|nr:hypothetical protein [Desulfovibrio subterraneus]GFM32186.1 hypothetical protein DSM101010T_05510 [Desulfovibrio subterraneus]
MNTTRAGHLNALATIRPLKASRILAPPYISVAFARSYHPPCDFFTNHDAIPSVLWYGEVIPERLFIQSGTKPVFSPQ